MKSFRTTLLGVLMVLACCMSTSLSAKSIDSLYGDCQEAGDEFLRLYAEKCGKLSGKEQQDYAKGFFSGICESLETPSVLPRQDEKAWNDGYTEALYSDAKQSLQKAMGKYYKSYTKKRGSNDEFEHRYRQCVKSFLSALTIAPGFADVLKPSTQVEGTDIAQVTVSKAGTSLSAHITNRTNTVLQVDWSKSSINYNQNSYPLVIDGQKYVDANRPMPPMMVPAKGDSMKSFSSAEQVHYSNGAKTWYESPIRATDAIVILCLVQGTTETYYSCYVPLL